MLSDDLEDLLVRIEKYRDTGVSLERQAVNEVCAILMSCAENARRLEAVILPARTLPDGVVDLFRRRLAEPDRCAPPPGGDAA